MYEAAYQTTFCATHRVLDGTSPIEPLHGHDWRVEVVAAREDLDRLGFVIDFEKLKEVVGGIAARFHYKDVNAHPDFGGRTVTAELLAHYFFEETRRGLGEQGALLRRVQIWEAPGCSAIYRAE